MSKIKAPKSLRFEVAINSVGQVIENNSGKTVSAVAGLIAVASFSGAEAQQQGEVVHLPRLAGVHAARSACESAGASTQIGGTRLLAPLCRELAGE